MTDKKEVESKPFAGFQDFDACLTEMQDEGYDKASAEKICGALQAEYEEAGEEEADNLKEKIKTHADNIITDLKLKLLSIVENPAQPSDIIQAKGKDDLNRKEVPILVSKKYGKEEKKEDEKHSIFAPAMIPNVTDKQGDVIPAHVIKESAHDFLKNGGGIDTDHDLIEGKGEIIESWTLKDERKFELPSGKIKTYPFGTWMVEVEVEDEVWERIKSGELSGFSIYGRSDKEELKVDEEKEKINENNINNDYNNKDDDKMDEEQFKELKDMISDLSDNLSEFKESIQSNQSDDTEEEDTEEQESESEEEQEKQEIENIADFLEWADENLPKDVSSMIVDALRDSGDLPEEESSEEEEQESEAEEQEEDEEGKSANFKQNDTNISDEEIEDNETKSMKDIVEKFAEGDEI